MPTNEQLLLTAQNGSGWLAPLACRHVCDAPQAFTVTADDDGLHMHHAGEWRVTSPYAWMEGDDRPDAELLALAASNALNAFQDLVAVEITEKWPMTRNGGMAQYNAVWSGN